MQHSTKHPRFSFDAIMADSLPESRSETVRKLGVLCERDEYRRFTSDWQAAYAKARRDIEFDLERVRIGVPL